MKKKGLLTIGETARKLGVSIDTLRRWDKKGILVSFRPNPKGNRYYRIQDIDRFIRNENLAEEAKQWILGPPSDPASERYSPTRDIFQARAEKMGQELQSIIPSDLSYLIVAVAGEIGNNAFDHNLGNWPDVPGVYFHYDLVKKQLVIADRGQGLFTTLKRVKPSLQNDQEALRVGFTEILSGRAPESRGNGLKFVREIITRYPLQLHFYTGNAMLELKENNQELAIKSSEKDFHGCLAVLYF